MESLNKVTPNSFINLLGQSETQASNRNQVAVSGNGIELSNKTKLKLRARRKLKTQAITLSIINIIQKENNPTKERTLWNTYYCQSKLHSAGSQIHGTYCKNRLCSICSSIRKAEILEDYLPIIQTWEEPCLVTLTIKACDKNELKHTVDRIMQAFNKIKDKHRKRSQRGRGKIFVGIRTLECNFKPSTNKYNPHLHLIVQNKEIAETLITDWLNTMEGDAQLEHQNVKKINDGKNELVKTIIYITKAFDFMHSKIEDGSEDILAHALNNIYDAMKSKRIFERFGFNSPKEKVKPKNEMIVLNDFKKWEFTQTDWIDDKGLSLTSDQSI